MLRNILSVIVGYVVMAALVFILLSVTYFVLGADGAFQEGVFAVSTAWLSCALIVGVVAAAGGGIACALISRRANPPRVLAALVLVLGLVYSMPRILAETPDPPERHDNDVPMFEAIAESQEPKWFLLTTPVTGAIGVLLGAAIVPRRRE